MPLLSRVAESLWWFGRYLERAESVARLLSVTYHMRFESDDPSAGDTANTWEALLTTLGRLDAYRETGGALDDASVMTYLALDARNPGSVRSALFAARENARSVRDFLSRESYEAANRAYREVAGVPAERVTQDGLYDFCNEVTHRVSAVRGALDSTCVHDEGWWWLIGGLTLERGDMSTRIVDAKYHLLLRSLDEVGGPADRFQWAALLRSVSGWEAYRRLHPEGIDPSAVTQFLLLDPTFPQALRSNVDSLATALERATAASASSLRNPPMRAVGQLQNRLRFESADALLAGGLHEQLVRFQQDLHDIQNQVGRAFFGWSADAA